MAYGISSQCRVLTTGLPGNSLYHPGQWSFPHGSVGKESTCNAGDPNSIPGSGGSTRGGVGSSSPSWRRGRLPTPVFLGFPRGSAGKESACNAGDLGSIPGLGRSPGEGKGYPLQCSLLENSMDCVVHGVAKSQTQLSHFHFTRTTSTPCLQGVP